MEVDEGEGNPDAEGQEVDLKFRNCGDDAARHRECVESLS
jgi:hypothetical protein